jgi:hypothetical protein
MRESDTFMAIIDEGRLEEVKKLILVLGEKKFGTPGDHVRTFVADTEDLDRLEFLHGCILDVKNWEELLATP